MPPGEIQGVHLLNTVRQRGGGLPDVSHLNDQSFADFLEVSQKPFVASHSNARSVCGHKRNLTDTASSVKASICRWKLR